MKKYLSLIMIAAALIVVSCKTAEPEALSAAGDKAPVTFCVSSPAGVATKAMGDADGSYELFYEVRLVNGADLGAPIGGPGDGLSGSQTVTSWPVSLTFDLAKAKTYKILFWAQSSAAEGLFTIGAKNGLTSVAIDYAEMKANKEFCDAFAGCSTITPLGATAVSLDLVRPFALINLGTTDSDKYFLASGGAKAGATSLKVTGTLGTAYNVETGAAVATEEGQFTFASEGPIDETLSVAGENYNYLHAVYVLPAEASSLVSAQYTINDNAATPAAITTLSLTNVPVKPNYRTNIVGKLLTGSAIYDIKLDSAFDGDKNKIDGPSFSSLAALNEYFANGLKTGPLDLDNGDIFPEQVIVTAIPDGDATTITLPNDTLSVAITILASYSDPAGLTIAYPTAAGAKHSQNVYFNMAGLSKLTANLPETHFELVSGSYVGIADVHTNTSTFVIQQGAKVGTVIVNKGNAKVEGEVATVEIATGATADGTNPVNVFVANTAAVKQITLNAPTDVVVEQPKDNIEMGEHDNKVAVTVTENAEGSSATAQNGGQIWVAYIGADTAVTAKGAESSAYIEEVTSGVEVTVEESDSGEVVINSDGPDVVLMRYKVDINESFEYTVKRTFYNPETGLFVETESPAVLTFKAAAAVAEADDYIVLRGSGEVNTVNINAGVTVDFNGYRLRATKICGIGSGKVIFRDSSFLVSSNPDSFYYSEYYNQFQSLVSFVANNFSTPYSEMDQETVAAIIGGGASYSGEIENVELRGGSYTFNPQQYTPNGIGLYKQFAEDFYMVALVPEANVLHQDVEPGMINPSGWISYGNASFIPFESIPITDGYLFLSQDDDSSVLNSFYQDWLVDYVFSFDKDVASSTTCIWGAYGTMCLGIALPAFEAGQTSGMLAAVGWDWNYSSIVNTVTAFGCGTVNVSSVNVGTTISVELRIAPNDGNGRENLTTPGKYIMINHYDYTYMGPTGTGQNPVVEEEEEP